MAEAITIPVEEEADDILQLEIDDFQAGQPDWVPNDGAPEVRLMRVFSLRFSVLLNVFTQVTTAIFRYFGESIARVPPIQATYATVDATFTLVDTVGHTIPAGLRVAINGDNDTSAIFEVLAETVVHSGSSTAVVSLKAQEEGSAFNDLSGSVTVLDPREWIQSIALLAATDGGGDAEEEAPYLKRLSKRLQRGADTIVTASDLEAALLEIPGVGRCLVLARYVPATESEAAQEDVPGAATAITTSAAGGDVSTPIREAIEAEIEENTVDGLQVHVINPTRTPITIAYTATSYPDWDPEAVRASADEAVSDYLSDATWGRLPSGEWQEDKLVRFGEIYAVLNGVQGLNHVTSVVINGLANTDHTLAGPGALPELTSVTGTVS